MAEESDLERSYPATPRRLEQAREQGQVARSRELTAAAVTLVAALGTSGLGPDFARHCARFFQESLTLDRAAAFSDERMLSGLANASFGMLVAIGPLLGLILVATLAAPMILSGWVFSGKALVPDFGRLNPLSGIRNVVSGHALAELVKSVAKSVLLVLVGGYAIHHLWNEMQSLVRLDVGTGIAHVGTLVITGLFFLVGAMVLVALVDVPYQLWRYHSGLRMTREEIRQEMKEQEGDPHLKARIRSLQRQSARKRMMAAVPKASVIVTNPTHYAVALEYREGMRAPRVVAKGMDLVAAKIRELGEKHRVPVVEAPPLARALHRHAELGDEVPQALYAVVAQVLAYVFQVQRWREQGGVMPDLPDDLDVPPELDPLAKSAAAGAPAAAGGAA